MGPLGYQKRSETRRAAGFVDSVAAVVVAVAAAPRLVGGRRAGFGSDIADCVAAPPLPKKSPMDTLMADAMFAAEELVAAVVAAEGDTAYSPPVRGLQEKSAAFVVADSETLAGYPLDPGSFQRRREVASNAFMREW